MERTAGVDSTQGPLEKSPVGRCTSPPLFSPYPGIAGYREEHGPRRAQRLSAGMPPPPKNRTATAQPVQLAQLHESPGEQPPPHLPSQAARAMPKQVACRPSSLAGMVGEGVCRAGPPSGPFWPPRLSPTPAHQTERHLITADCKTGSKLKYDPCERTTHVYIKDFKTPTPLLGGVSYGSETWLRHKSRLLSTEWGAY